MTALFNKIIDDLALLSEVVFFTQQFLQIGRILEQAILLAQLGVLGLLVLEGRFGRGNLRIDPV
mgnify:CR=1 FL=1